MKKKLIITEDGSHTYFVPQYGECYHSVHGAIQESRHVFIESGLKMLDKNTLSVFEMGFGSGLNALLTWDYARSGGLTIFYDTIEMYPISIAEASEFNYPELLGIPNEDFISLHSSEWGKRVDMEPCFKLLKMKADMRSFSPEGNYDLIYFDAFSPQVQPDLWKTTIFHELFRAMAPGGILTSYSVRGDFRRALSEVGFQVEKIPGPPGKRHITRAKKQ